MRVHAVGVLPADCKTRRSSFKNCRLVTFPDIPGSPFAGVIEFLRAGEFTLADVHRAHQRVETGHSRGRIVLVLSE